jgi:hypothetical protein
VCFSLHKDLPLFGQFGYADEARKRWSQVFEVFPVEELRDVDLWWSPKHSFGEIEMNLWFAGNGVNCGIYRGHEFLEIHTGIWDRKDAEVSSVFDNSLVHQYSSS